MNKMRKMLTALAFLPLVCQASYATNEDNNLQPKFRSHARTKCYVPVEERNEQIDEIKKSLTEQKRQFTAQLQMLRRKINKDLKTLENNFSAQIDETMHQLDTLQASITVELVDNPAEKSKSIDNDIVDDFLVCTEMRLHYPRYVYPIDYYGSVCFIGQTLYFLQRNAEGNIIYNPPEYEMRKAPFNDADVQAFYDKNGKLSGNKNQLYKLLKKKVDDLIGNSTSNYYNSLMMVATNANKEPCLKYSNVYLGKNTYCDNPNQKKTGTNPKRIDGQFYFGIGQIGHDRLQYVNGIDNLNNLAWRNLIFTGRDPASHVPFVQVLIEVGMQDCHNLQNS